MSRALRMGVVDHHIEIDEHHYIFVFVDIVGGRIIRRHKYEQE
ncbi:MAG: hypothetical protein V4568_02485 [Pseudomonadota bacterium]